MRLYGLIGFPLSHSFSAGYFEHKFAQAAIEECLYRNFAIQSIELLPEMIAANRDLKGFNVTIPYKEQVMRYLDAISDQAREVGAVNCIRIDGGRLTGYNTDVYGFRESLLGLLGDERPSKALVLGTGGASKAVRYALAELGIAPTNVSRQRGSDAISYQDVTPEVLRDHKLIVNTTPLGMYPNIDTAPTLPYEALGEGHFLFDLTYNPDVTRFLRYGVECGAKIKNGYDMLVLQAECSWSIWEARSPSSAATISSIGDWPLERKGNTD